MRIFAILFRVQLNVAEGQLIGVVGRVGAGKSSLISAILGEMNRVNGSVNVKVHYSLPY